MEITQSSLAKEKTLQNSVITITPSVGAKYNPNRVPELLLITFSTNSGGKQTL